MSDLKVQYTGQSYTIIHHNGTNYVCREVYEPETGLTHTFAPIELGELLVSEDGEQIDPLDDEFGYYFSQDEAGLPDEDLLRLMYND